MAKNKTTDTGKNVLDFIHSFADTDQKREDSIDLMHLMQKVSGYEPRMWGPSIVGFGSYHYKYASGHEGDAPLLGFSPRKAALTLYVHTGRKEHEHLLKDLGKCKISKGCIYVKKLSDIDGKKLVALMKESLKYMKANYECT